MRQAITLLHQAILDHQDPQAKQTLAGCLAQMMKVQALDHQTAAQGQDATQAVQQRLGGGF